MTPTPNPADLADLSDDLRKLLREEGLKELSYDLRQGSDQTGEYHVTRAQIRTGDVVLIDLMEHWVGDWSETTLDLFCKAVNALPTLLDLLAAQQREIEGLRQEAYELRCDKTELGENWKIDRSRANKAEAEVAALKADVSTYADASTEALTEVEALKAKLDRAAAVIEAVVTWDSVCGDAIPNALAKQIREARAELTQEGGE